MKRSSSGSQVDFGDVSNEPRLSSSKDSVGFPLESTQISELTPIQGAGPQVLLQEVERRNFPDLRVSVPCQS